MISVSLAVLSLYFGPASEADKSMWKLCCYSFRGNDLKAWGMLLQKVKVGSNDYKTDCKQVPLAYLSH